MQLEQTYKILQIPEIYHPVTTYFMTTYQGVTLCGVTIRSEMLFTLKFIEA